MARILAALILALSACTVSAGPSASACNPACAAGSICCAAGTATICRQVQNDPGNCGGCGIRCGAGQQCQAGICEYRQGTDTVDAGVVDAGPCGPTCPSTWDCVTVDGVPRCLDLPWDRNNCGTAGHVCPGDESCFESTCRCGSGDACGEGLMCCGGACIDVQSNPEHCGGCDVACGAAGPSCADGACRCGASPACRAASTADTGELCCADSCVPRDNTGCLGCSQACNAGSTCVYGMSLSGTWDVCCGTAIPGFGGFCIDLPADGGVPFPFDAGGGPRDAGSAPDAG